MRASSALWGLAAQTPFHDLHLVPAVDSSKREFTVQEGPEIFTAENLIEVSSTLAALVNNAGDLALLPTSKYSFENQTNYQSFYVLSLTSNLYILPIQVPLDNGGDTFWLSNRTVANIVWSKDQVELYALDVTHKDNIDISISGERQYIGKIPSATASSFQYNPDSKHLVFSDMVYPDGNLTSVKEQDALFDSRGNSAYVYDSGIPRDFRGWIGPKRTHLFSVRLSRDNGGIWSLGDVYHSPLKGTGHYSPVEFLGSAADFDVSATAIVYTTKDPNLPEHLHSRQNIYIVDLEGKVKPRELTSGKQGMTQKPVFNAAGTKVAWLELEKDGYIFDRTDIVVYDLQKDVRFKVTHNWDFVPESVIFSREDDYLIFTAGDQARVKIFTLPLPPTPERWVTDYGLDGTSAVPFALTHLHTASSIQALPSSRILFLLSSFTSPNDVYITDNIKKLGFTGDISEDDHLTRLTRLTENEFKGKDLRRPEEIWFQGAKNTTVQGWIAKPKGWTPGKRVEWPVIFYIHGGPQAAWTDMWFPYRGFSVYTEQGYFVVALHFAGSTTFGYEFANAITGDWGGRPFIDLLAGWKHVLTAYPEIDKDRAVALGPSWGGYAVNWIQGHPEYGFNFKAMVCNVGIFDLAYTAYVSDQPSGYIHEFKGMPWEAGNLLEKFNPRKFVNKWSTPQLLIHGSLDYHLPETEAIAAFNALQQLGVPSRLVILPDENHFVSRPGNQLKVFREILRWFDQFVGSAD